jgi:hypothetical protein
MPNLSCFYTQPQVRDRSKTVSRRLGWKSAKPGLVVKLIVKGQGLKRGEKIEVMAIVEIVSVRFEPLEAITQADCVLEGFPHYSPADFVKMFSTGINRVAPSEIVTRLEWKYREDLWSLHQMAVAPSAVRPEPEFLNPNFFTQPKEP